MRTSGILMPIFSLPSPYGIGTLGDAAHNFIKFLKSSGQTYWQILPIGPTSYGDSPYQSFSSFAGNPYFIDLDVLVGEGLLTTDEIKAQDFGNDHTKIDYEKLYLNRYPLLKMAFKRFKADASYDVFVNENSHWLHDYALFMAIKQATSGNAWYEWDKSLVKRDLAAIEKAESDYIDDINFYKFI